MFLSPAPKKRSRGLPVAWIPSIKLPVDDHKLQLCRGPFELAILCRCWRVVEHDVLPLEIRMGEDWGVILEDVLESAREMLCLMLRLAFASEPGDHSFVQA